MTKYRDTYTYITEIEKNLGECILKCLKMVFRRFDHLPVIFVEKYRYGGNRVANYKRNNFSTFKVQIGLKMSGTFFDRIPKFAFLWENPLGWQPYYNKNNFYGPARRFSTVRELFEDNCLKADGRFSVPVR
jgi:hypothetical protein